MGRYTARIAAKRVDRLCLLAIGVWPIVLDYAALFTVNDREMEDWIEQEILDRFGGYDAMEEVFEAEIAGQKSMTAAEAIAFLRSFGTRDKSD